jgi:predicted O-linked N-acetylglucosamine transferase (SPINDLY family)
VPSHAEAWSLLGTLLQDRALSSESMAAHRRSIELRANPTSHTKLLQAMQYAEDVSPENLLIAHCQWNASYTLPPPAAATSRHRSENTRLRIGFVSSGLGIHPIGHMVLPVLEHLDKTACSVVCYSDRASEDEYTARFRAASDDWRATFDMTTEELVRVISGDAIDILVDLDGHTGKRLLVFAEKPASVQLTWFGYVGTTGLAAMDFLLADRFHIRPEEEQWYSERVLRMPNDYACFAAPAYAPHVVPPPGLRSGTVTFGCFNHPTKYSARTFDAWSEILRRVPAARLLLKYDGLQEAEFGNYLNAEIARRGIATERVSLEGASPHQELLGNYNRVDLALDTQPYSGGVTTCEALWMGVPVITFPGKTFAGRHSTSHLMNAGYSQFVADDSGGYVNLAVEWANRLDELAMIRSQMREQVRESPLCDAPRFANDFLDVLQQAWQPRTSGAL